MQSDMLQHDPLPFYASVTQLSDNSILLHSWIKGYKPRIKSTSFWDNIRSYGNPSIWKNLQCYGNGSWIWQGLCSRSLVIVHDGLYMKEISPFVRSATIIIHCITTGSLYKCTIAENTLYAGSYHSKILGIILTQLILIAAVQGRMGPYPVVIEDCNNKGVIKHGNTPYWPITTTQTQSDVLHVMKQYVIAQSFKLKFSYVASHCDDSKSWANCTLKERINIKVDSLAKKALICAHATNDYFDGIFPEEDFCIFVNNTKVTGPIKSAIEEQWGREAEREFLDWKWIVPSSEFNCIWWKGMKMAMDSYPKMSRIFVVKKVSGWCGSNSKQSLWDTSINNICPHCGVTNETSKHMTHCQNHGRAARFKESVAEVVPHLEKAKAAISLIKIVETYLLAQESCSLASCIVIPDP
jgi:hypothetical protein